MKFSTRATYGLRLCFMIGIAEGQISLSSIAKQTGLSEKYLEQLLAMLKKGGLVESKRGATGGYTLSRDPSEISIRDILVAVGDDVEVSDCLSGECADEYCPNCKIFTRLRNAMVELLSSFTLRDMINDYKCY